MSLIDKEVSDFKVKAYHNEEIIDVELKDIKGKWTIFFFYPAELEDLADNYEAFKKLNAEIYSVSCDTEFVHKAWHDASPAIKKIDYIMLADPTAALAKDFDVYIENKGQAERGTFIVNPDGKIASYEVVSGSIGRNAEELLRKLSACKFVYEHDGEVCPAKWKEGEETLKPSLDLVGKI